MGNLTTGYENNIEIDLLKSKLDRFTENVSTKLDDLAFEINHIKENKPYSAIKLTFSVIITRADDKSLTRKVNHYNRLFAKLCIERNWKLIGNNNINKSHLNKNGTSILAKSFKHFLNTNYSI